MCPRDFLGVSYVLSTSYKMYTCRKMINSTWDRSGGIDIIGLFYLLGEQASKKITVKEDLVSKRQLAISTQKKVLPGTSAET